MRILSVNQVHLKGDINSFRQAGNYWLLKKKKILREQLGPGRIYRNQKIQSLEESCFNC